MLSDLKYATRMLVKSPGFAAAALVALALGIGATTAMFTAVNSVLLRPLPYPEADRLYLMRETRPIAGFERTVVSEGEFLRWTRDHPLIEHAAVVTNPGLAIRFGDRPERISVLQVAADFFPLFGVTPVAGRVFGRDAEQPGRGDVMLITYAAWQKRFSGGADVVGRVVPVEGRPTTILGILPRRFTFGGPFEAIVPMTLGPDQAAQFGDHSLDVYARLKPGVTAEAVTADLTRRVLATPESTAHATGAVLLPLQEQVVGGARAPMLVLFGAVGLVLLVACANIANLLLARAASRQKEMAVRSALGATRGRVVRQLVTESLLLSAVGGVLGSLFALWLSDVLARVAADAVPRAAEIGMDGRALAFGLATSGLCGLIFGIVPAWHAARPDPSEALKQETRGGSMAGRRRLLSAFAVSEIALALILLVGAGLLLSTFRNLRRVEAGFDPAPVVTAPAFLPDWKYATADLRRAFFRRAVGDLGSIPGVAAAAAVNVLPLSGDNSSGAMTPEGWRPAAPNQRESADRRAVTPDYFSVMGIRLLQGRPFSEQDDDRAPRVAIVSRALAERYWRGESPIGKRLKLARYAVDAPWLTVVGVAADVRHGTLAEPSRQVVYYPHAQSPEGGMVLVIRSAGALGAIAPAVRSAMQRIDPDLPMDAIEPMTAVVGASLANQRLEFSLLGAFAVLAVVLAAAGIYGVMAYGIIQRTQEFGIRLALGASPTDILRLVGREGLGLTGAGITIGLVGAWLGSSVLARQLYGVRPADPAIYGATALLLAAIALAACFIPARRALAVNPITTLRG